MKKVVRIVWISLLSGLAFLAACVSNHNSSKGSKFETLYGSPEVDAPVANQEEINEMNARLDRIEQRINEMKGPDKNERRKQLQQQLDSISEILHRREGACIYGSPEVMERYRNETLRLHKEASKLQQQLEDLDKE
mgnify:CR=1 FL=1